MKGAYKFVYRLLYGIVNFYFRLKFVGRENEPKEGAYLVCSNHISAADPLLISAAMRRQVSYMAKKELFKIPILRGILKSVGVFPVDRGGKDVGAVKKAIALLKEGNNVGIFPQGTRRPGVDPRLTDLKTGAAMIAIKADVDILPVFIHRKDNTPKPFRKTTVIVGKPIKLSSLGYDPDASGEYHRIISAVFDEICKLGEDFEKCQK